mmetsp:Transcript_37303/g.107776  ORF Transcript_37303/g.107776 Transcript_37303/m.107776 type:complete len:257 (+) Transcript_37303:848-1618(+)
MSLAAPPGSTTVLDAEGSADVSVCSWELNCAFSLPWISPSSKPPSASGRNLLDSCRPAMAASTASKSGACRSLDTEPGGGSFSCGDGFSTTRPSCPPCRKLRCWPLPLSGAPGALPWPPPSWPRLPWYGEPPKPTMLLNMSPSPPDPPNGLALFEAVYADTGDWALPTARPLGGSVAKRPRKTSPMSCPPPQVSAPSRQLPRPVGSTAAWDRLTGECRCSRPPSVEALGPRPKGSGLTALNMSSNASMSPIRSASE